MKRVNILWLLLDSLFLIAFNVLFFMFVDYRTDSVWVSYGFIHFSYILMLLTPLFEGVAAQPIFTAVRSMPLRPLILFWN